MSLDESSLIAFLDFVLSENPAEAFARIPKCKLLEALKKYLSNLGGPDDPNLVFEDWERFLRKSFFIKNHLIRYNIYNETLTVEIVPSLQLMNRAAETYGLNLRSSVINALSTLSFQEFEQLMREIFQKVPWVEQISITQLSRDGGIDFEGVYRDRKSGLRLTLFGQAKHWNSKVGSETIRTFIGSISVRLSAPAIGIFVSTSGYTDDAKAVMLKSPIRILSYDIVNLADLMIEHEVGVKTFRIEGKVIDDVFWKEIRE